VGALGLMGRDGNGARRLGPDGDGANGNGADCLKAVGAQTMGHVGDGANRLIAGATALGCVGDGASARWGATAMERDSDGARQLGPGGDGHNGDGHEGDGAQQLGPDGNEARRQWCRLPQRERPGRVADPLSLVVDVTSWYDEEQLRLVKGTN
jgi:hypothetical protein